MATRQPTTTRWQPPTADGPPAPASQGLRRRSAPRRSTGLERLGNRLADLSGFDLADLSGFDQEAIMARAGVDQVHLGRVEEKGSKLGLEARRYKHPCEVI